MHPRCRLSRSLIGAVLISAAACRGDDATPITGPAKPAPVEPAVVSLQLSGFAPFVGSSEAFQATATLADGSMQAVTSHAEWRSSNPAVATVDAAGTVVGVGSGDADIWATYRSYATMVRITLSDDVPVLSASIVDLSGRYDSTAKRIGALDCNGSPADTTGQHWCFNAFGGSTIAGKQVPAFDYKVVANASVYAATAGVVVAIIPHDDDGAYPGEYTVHTKSSPASPYTVQYDHVKDPTVVLGASVAAGAKIGTAGQLRPGSSQGRVELQLIKAVSFHPTFETLNLCPASFGTPQFNQLNDAARTAHNTANPQYVELSVCMAATMK